MPPVTITMTFDSPADAAMFLSASGAPKSDPWPQIDLFDRPDVGAPEFVTVHLPDGGVTTMQLPVRATTAAPASPAAVFGSAAVQIPPPLGAVPAASAAPSTADAAALPIVPEAPTVTSPQPPTASAPSAPTPEPSAAAPTAPVAPTSPVDGEVDVTGLRWDERIHSQNRSKNADGTWRQKRGLNDLAMKARVEAELRGVVAAAPAAAEPAAPAAPAVPAAPAPVVPAAPVAPVAAVPAAPDQTAAPTVATAAPQSWTFSSLLTAVVKAKIPQDTIAAVLPAVAGVDAFGQLATKLVGEPQLGDQLAVAFGLVAA